MGNSTISTSKKDDFWKTLHITQLRSYIELIFDIKEVAKPINALQIFFNTIYR